MSSVLRYLEFLSLGTWLGSVIYMSFVVAPAAFATAGSRDAAGALVSVVLARLHFLGLAAGMIFLVSRAAAAKSISALASVAAVLVILMLLLTVVSRFWVSPRMAGLRGQMGSVDRTPAESPLRMQFNRLHGMSVALETVVLLAGLLALFFFVRETQL